MSDTNEEKKANESPAALAIAGFEDNHPTLVKAAKVVGILLVGIYAGRHWFKKARR